VHAGHVPDIATGARAVPIYIADLVEQFALAAVWVMPRGTSPAAVLDGQRRLADAVLNRGWNVSTRLHILLWGDEPER
jgi:7-carboxy-7-deazaguanine synthase